jgi:pilus assembly protein CpaF
MYKFIQSCVLAKKNMIISGGTSSGKTTLLNLVCDFIPDGERIITIEDSCELQIKKSHILPMETKKPDARGQGEFSIRDLLVVSLRMRPDRIIIGECRSGEALDMLQAMNTGHSGSLTTLHANSGKDTLHRLETMALMSGVDLPLIAVRSQVASAVSVILQTSRLPDGSRKLTEIVEVLDLDMDGNYCINPIYAFLIQGKDKETGKVLGTHKFTGNAPTFAKELSLLSDIDLPEEIIMEQKYT